MNDTKTLADLEKALKQIERTHGFENPALVGTLLRDLYQIPSVRAITGLKLTQFVKNMDQTRYELKNINERLAKIQAHVKTNKKDVPAKRTYVRNLAKKANLNLRYNKKPRAHAQEHPEKR